MPELIEGVHYYINEDGWVVLTAKYLLERGYCCGNGCLHCPFDYMNVEQPRRTELLEKRRRVRRMMKHFKKGEIQEHLTSKAGANFHHDLAFYTSYFSSPVMNMIGTNFDG